MPCFELRMTAVLSFEARRDLESPSCSGACILTELLDTMIEIWLKLMTFQSSYMGIIC